MKNKIEIIKKQKNKSKSIITAVISIISLVVAAMSFSQTFSTTEDKILNYSEKSNIKYDIKLKENNFYSEDTQKSDMTYIADLIDYIETQFNYELNFDNEVEYSYSYNIDANLHIQNKGSSEDADNKIFEKKEELIHSGEKTSQSKKLAINEKISIPYDKYNEIVKEFVKAHGITPECYLDLSFSVNAKGKFENIENISRDSTVNLKIPLNEKLIDINEDGASKEDNGSFVGKGVSKSSLGIAIAASVIAFIFLILTIKFIIDCLPKRTEYEKKLRSILRRYESVIVKCHLDVDLEKTATEVASVEDLIKVSDMIQQPIKYYEVVKGEKSVFIIENMNSERYIFYVNSI